jgi:hypothetical protein
MQLRHVGDGVHQALDERQCWRQGCMQPSNEVMTLIVLLLSCASPRLNSQGRAPGRPPTASPLLTHPDSQHVGILCQKRRADDSPFMLRSLKVWVREEEEHLCQLWDRCSPMGLSICECPAPPLPADQPNPPGCSPGCTWPLRKKLGRCFMALLRRQAMFWNPPPGAARRARILSCT